MIALLFAGVLAAVPALGAPEQPIGRPAPTAPAVRIPGTRLRLGQPLAEIDTTGGFHAAGGSSTMRTGTCRFFGIDSRASLEFHDERLVRAVFEVDSLSPHAADYVQDQLRRLGYRPRWESPDPARLECEWNGTSRVVLKLAAPRLLAEVTSAPRAPAPIEPAVAVTTVEDPGAPIPDTLAIGHATGRYPAPDYEAPGAIRPSPRYPDAARRAAVQGVVRVLARVDTTGAVIETALARSIPELDDAALEAVRGSRFRPYVFEGRPRSFRVIIPVVFTLH